MRAKATSKRISISIIACRNRETWGNSSLHYGRCEDATTAGCTSPCDIDFLVFRSRPEDVEDLDGDEGGIDGLRGFPLLPSADPFECECECECECPWWECPFASPFAVFWLSSLDAVAYDAAVTAELALVDRDIGGGAGTLWDRCAEWGCGWALADTRRTTRGSTDRSLSSLRSFRSCSLGLDPSPFGTPSEFPFAFAASADGGGGDGEASSGRTVS